MTLKKRIRKAIGFVIVIALAIGIAMPAQAANRFKDVSPSAWYYTAVEWAVQEGLFAGTSTDTFSPNMGMTRGMFVTVLGRRAGVDNAMPASSSFTDVQLSDYFAPYVEWAKENGIVSGTSQTTFSPSMQITREQMATILYRYAEKSGCDTSLTDSGYNSFPDAVKVSGYAWQAMQWAVRKGIIQGSGGKLNPQGTATRAQVAQVFYNARGVLEDNVPTAGPSVPAIALTSDQRAQLSPEQDPDELLRQVMAGTSAKWDPTIDTETAFAGTVMRIGLVERDEYTEPEYWIGSTDYTAFNMLEDLNDTGADRFLVKAWDAVDIGQYYKDGTPAFSGRYLDDGSYQPARGLTLYYTIPEKMDSLLMTKIRKLVEKEFPHARFTPETIRTGHGWRGYERSDEADWIAYIELRYLQEWYEPSDSFDYWISEPEPGKFYFYY